MNDGSRASAKVARERVIENALIANPDVLGYPNALAIRNWRVSPHSGRLDVVLMPESGPLELVLIEAKAAVAPDAASKVVGQLMMYYAGALSLGSEGVRLLRAFAAEDRARAIGTSKKSMVQVAGLGPSAAAWAALSRGESLKPAQLAMYIALDNDPHHALEPVLDILRQYHQLPIGLIVVRDGMISRVLPALSV